MKKLLILALLLGVCSAASGAVTNTVSDTRTMKRMCVYWTVSASGGVNGVTAPISGIIERYMIVPDSGATGPTNLYDMTLVDDDGMDILNGQGANLGSNTTYKTHAQYGVTNGLPIAVDDGSGLYLSVTNAGPENAGHLVIWFR